MNIRHEDDSYPHVKMLQIRVRSNVKLTLEVRWGNGNAEERTIEIDQEFMKQRKEDGGTQGKDREEEEL